MAQELVVSHALIIRGHGAGLSWPGCEPRTDRSHPVSVRTAAHTRLLLQSQCAKRQNRTRTRPRSVPASARSTGPPRPVGVGFDDFLQMTQMTSVIGSSTAHTCGRRSSHPAPADEIDGARVPRISRPPPSGLFFLYRWLPRVAGHDWHGCSIDRAGRLTDAAFGLDDRSARSIGARFRPLTRFFGANDQRHGVEHRPLVRTAQAPIWRPRMRSTGSASLGFAALLRPVCSFFTGGYLVWPGTIGMAARSTGPVV
jgi:hypothetical protein